MSALQSISLLWKELTVPPKSSNYNPVLTGIRSIAFLWVCSLHSFIFYEMLIGIEHSKPIQQFANHPLISVIFSGTCGVEVFLVLSGFLLAQDLWNQFNLYGRIHIYDTIKQRLIRLYPTFIVLELCQMVSPSITCPCISELFFIGTHASGCLPAVWSTIVDFQAWILLISLFALTVSLTDSRNVRLVSLSFGGVLVFIWMAIRVFRTWTEQYSPNPKLLYLPDLLDLLQKEYPNAPWMLGEYRSVESEGQRIALYHFVDNFYFNFFTKFGSVVAGFVLYFILNATFKDSSSTEPKNFPFQTFLIKHQVAVTLFCIALSSVLVTTVVYPANLRFMALPKAIQLLYMALHQPLTLCILITMLTVPSNNLTPILRAFYAIITKFLSWSGWYFFSKISYAGYYWSSPASGIVALVLYPLHLNSEIPLGFQYFTALAINLSFLIPMSLITHVLVERQAIKWFRSKPSRLDQKDQKNS